MKTRTIRLNAVAVLAGLLLTMMTGCTSTSQRAGEVGLGAAAGAGIGAAFAPAKNRAGVAAIGALAGGGLTALALGDDKKVYQRGVDDGYVAGAADEVKRLYWAKQALEAPNGSDVAGHMSYYTWLDDGTTPDGRKLAPERVAVPIYQPTPTAGN